MKGNKNKKWQDVADLLELPVGRRSLARPVALCSPHEREDVSEISSLRPVFPWRLRTASHKEHGVVRAPATLGGRLSHPGAVAAWN